MHYLKQSTAATIKLGPFVDSTDGVTAETALTIAQADIRLSKNGGDIAQTNNSAGATHDELGYYNVPLDTTDTNTLGTLKVIVHESGALPVFADFMVITAEAYDTFCGSDHFTVELADDAITSAKFDESTAYPLTSADSGSTAVARTGADSDTLETLSDQMDLQATATELAKVPKSDGTATWNATALASINAECDTALTDYDAATGTELAAVDGKIDTIDGIVDTIVADTDEIQQELADGGRLDLIFDATLADTNELQTNQGNWLTATGFSTHDAADVKTAIEAAGSHLTLILEDTGTTLPTSLSGIDSKIDTLDTVADGIQTDLDNGTDGLGALKALIDTLTAYVDTEIAAILEDTGTTIPDLIAALNNLSSAEAESACDAAIDNAISSPTSNSLGYYIQKMFIALVNKMVVTEASGNTEQFNDSNVSIGTINGAITSDGTYTTRLRMVQ